VIATEAGLRIAAPAKINLYLHVVGRRADGYHLLDSLVAFTDIGDELTLTPDTKLSLTIDGPFANDLAADEGNLVLRAARALAPGEGSGAAIRLTKNLPVASGIGGGSADAAAALAALNRLWELRLPASRLAEIGLALGADVPVCLAGRPSYVGGIGDDVVPAPGLPAAHLVLVNPGAPLATAEVFRARARGPLGTRYSAPSRWTAPPVDVAGLARLLAARGNDLEDTAIALMPAIADAVARLRRSPACLLARLSGSGATCFGLFGRQWEAFAAAAAIAAERPDWWVRATRLLTGSLG
jgi:4-diphosphocytidyl-2-C-methyl-D-erythritol kinase